MRFPMACILIALSPGLAQGQGRSTVEVGTGLGLTVQSSGGSTLTAFSVPGQGVRGQPTIYATFFSGEALLIEPQLALNVLSSGGNTLTTVGLGGQLGYLPAGPEVNSAFLAATLGFQSISGGGRSTTDFGVGAKVGYRIVTGVGLGVRLEGGFRRWFDTELTEITIGMGIGGIVRRP